MSYELSTLRHSAAHIMAYALTNILGHDVRFAIGPSIESGFYYDFASPVSVDESLLPRIEEEMGKIIAQNVPFERSEVSRQEALELFAGNPYKTELIHELPEGEPIVIYRCGDYVDLCRGPHVEKTGNLTAKAVKLLSIAGAYWRGDEKNDQLTRIYGTAFSAPKELRAYLDELEEIKSRDHRRIGKDLDLFSLQEKAGSGLAFWHPKGAAVRLAVEGFWREQHKKAGYGFLFTPHIGRSWLWETSGHLSFYKESMFPSMDLDETQYYLKPMNCPFHVLVFKSHRRSYREMPVRFAEFGTVYRYEKSGTMHGLLRVRGFTQDDAHIFVPKEQLVSEILSTVRFGLGILRTFGFSDFQAFLSTKPEKAVGEDNMWVSATSSLENALKELDIPYELDEGGGAFYGPKIDIKVKDALGRFWQLSTIQFDFNLPERFDVSFINKAGEKERPYMIHRALLGSLERFFAILIEHYKGAFPPWLAPQQAVVIPVSPEQSDYAQKIAQQLVDKDIDAQADLSDERMNAKIRLAQQQKIPCIVIVGAKEEQSSCISLRDLHGHQKNGVSFEEAAEHYLSVIQEKKSTYDLA